MKKSMIITIYTDGVDLQDVESIQEGIESVFEKYADKRITIQIQEERLVRMPI